MTYTTAIYKLDRRQKKGLIQGLSGPLSLPTKLPFKTIADLMVRGQSVCFRDGNVNNDNKERLVKMFKMKASSNQATVAVLMSMGYFEDPNNMFTANDMGILTIQKAPIGLMTDDVIRGNEKVFWINEVCRSNFNREKVPRSDGPIPNIMLAAEDFARSEGQRSIFLMVEQNPQHGDGNVLLQYYGEGFKGKGGYGYQVIGEGSGYWYMMKDLSITSMIPDDERDEEMIVEADVVTPGPAIITQQQSDETMMQNLQQSLSEIDALPTGAGLFTRKRKKKHRRKTINKKHKKHKLKNTKNKSCKSKKMSSCCPHMMPVNGKYMATTKKHKLKYNGKIYIFRTCCSACAMSMKSMATKNPNKFAKTYIARVENNALLLKNRHTGKVVQKAVVKRRKTAKKR